MSSWHGGKGDKSRVTDVKAYWDSPLWKKKDNTTGRVSVDENENGETVVTYNKPIKFETKKKDINYNHEKCLFLDDENLFLDDENSIEPLNNISEETDNKD